jgi:hypothetical protein
MPNLYTQLNGGQGSAKKSDCLATAIGCRLLSLLKEFQSVDVVLPENLAWNFLLFYHTIHGIVALKYPSKAKKHSTSSDARFYIVSDAIIRLIKLVRGKDLSRTSANGYVVKNSLYLQLICI